MSGSDTDDLDYNPATRRRPPSSSIPMPSSSSLPPPIKPPPPRKTYDPGERITMTDDEGSDDEIRLQFKRRRKGADATSSTSSTSALKRSSTAVHTSSNNKSVPAKRPRTKADTKNKITGLKPRKKERPVQLYNFGGPEEKEKEGEDEKSVLPKNLLSKREEFRRAKAALEAGEEVVSEQLKFPPQWGEIEFSDDEGDLTKLAEKPQLGEGVEKSAPWQDIMMEESLGVIPCSIAQYLRPYQVEGAKFLHRAFVYQEGCILGDDMGLGKTIQVIAFLTAAFGKTADERDAKRMRKVRQWRRFHEAEGRDKWYPKVLIVCPSSLIENWMQELEKWGWWYVFKYHGSKSDKENALNAAEKGSLEIMITNYETYRINAMEINEIEWDAVIADECHKIKGKWSYLREERGEGRLLMG